MREIVAFSLIGFIVLFVALLLLLWMRKRQRAHQAIWGKRQPALKPPRPGLNNDSLG